MPDRDNHAWMVRSTAFELLAIAFLFPQREGVNALVSGEFSEACAEAFGSLNFDEIDLRAAASELATYRGSNADEVFHELRREYTRLYVGEREPLIMPFAGVVKARKRGQKGLLFVGAESMAIERFMRRCGVEKAAAKARENDPVDHIGTMCEFLQYLSLINAGAVKAPPGAIVKVSDYDTFFKNHFRDYAHWLGDQTGVLTRGLFYRAMARLLVMASSM